MATKQFGKLKLHWSKRGIAYKWGDGDIHRLSFDRFMRGGQNDPEGSDPQNEYYADEGQNNYQDDGYYDAQERDGDRYAMLYSNDWIMYALLVVLPPLGIWILWKRDRFAPTVRAAVSAASAIWFIILLVWLFSAMFGGGQDPVTQNPSNVPAPTPPAAVATPFATDNADLTATVAPAAPTPRPSGTVGNVSDSSNAADNTDVTGTTPTDDTSSTDDDGTTYVWASNTSSIYHKTNTCPDLEEGATRIDLNLAKQRATACPVCYPNSATSTTTYYYTKNGKYYHKNSTCSDIKNPIAATLKEVQKTNNTACPICVGAYYGRKDGKYYHKDSNCSNMSNATRLTKAQIKSYGLTACPVCVKKSSATASTATKYYATTSGNYYHKSKTCPTLKGVKASLIKAVTKAVAEKNGKKACPTCLSATTTAASKAYYATSTGKYYHVKSTCSGMKNAKKITLTTAKKYGKTACPVCIAQSKNDASSGSNTAATAYYATAAGNYYHKSKACTTLKNVKDSLIKKVTKATAEKYGKTACPTCLSTASTSYCYATSGGKYYHKNSTCSGMRNAKRVALSVAKKKGLTACPVCYKAEAAKKTYYYSTANNKYYHVKSGCSGMLNAKKITLATAKKYSKTACPVCIGKKSSTTYYYATKANKYYHKLKGCSDMVNPSKVTAAVAKKAGKLPCPICVTKTATATPTPAPKVYCYASSGSKYYHKNKTCTGLKNAKKVLLSTAKKKGKTACPICVTQTIKKSNLTTNFADNKTACYASASSAYYHSTKSCVAGLKATTVEAAKRKGKSACPTCASDLNTYVYVTRSGVKYHRKATCDGAANAYKISLSSALQLNYVRCTKCNAPKATQTK